MALANMHAPADTSARCGWWHRLHAWRWYARWPLKVAALALVVMLVLYPKVWLIPVWAARLNDLNSVVDPNDPALAPLEAEVRAQLAPGTRLPAALVPVEKVVYAHVPYAFDWDTWGVMDYLPTVAEVFAQGREDCDGRAVVATALLQRLGYEAWLACDLKHTWVAVRDPSLATADSFELMAPGKGEKTLVGAGAGTRWSLTLGTFSNFGRALAFGIAVFPLGREIIILIALCAVLLQPRASPLRRIVGCAVLTGALILLRVGGTAPSGMMLWAWLGVMAVVAGCLLLAVPRRTVHAGGRAETQ